MTETWEYILGAFLWAAFSVALAVWETRREEERLEGRGYKPREMTILSASLIYPIGGLIAAGIAMFLVQAVVELVNAIG